MKNVTFRVPEETKEKMEELSVNWSEYLRDSVEKALDREQKREIHQKLKKYEETDKTTAPEIIREIRDNG
ncbi:MAG: hypothetical protein ACQEP7_04165 [bacterium]